LIETELARGELVLAHPAPLPGARHYYLVLPEGSDDKPTLQRFSTWLQQASQG
jgi:DNA-binding transcriptional LysR family regulator